MNNIKYAFILTSIAGASTLIGLLPIFFKVKNENKLISMFDFRYYIINDIRSLCRRKK